MICVVFYWFLPVYTIIEKSPYATKRDYFVFQSVGETQFIVKMDPTAQDVQKYLIETTEKPKTKLPFCIFLLSNGAVGMYMDGSITGRSWYSDTHLCCR